MSYKAVIFDLDGTLVNTIDDLSQAINIALKNKGYPFSYDNEGTKKLIGQGTKVLCQRAIAPLNPTEEMWKDLFVEFSKQYNIHELDHAHLYEGVLDTVNELKSLGLKVAVLSNKVDHNSKDIISHLCPEGTFDIVQGQLDNVPLKPDPTSLFNLMKRLGVNKDEVLYVGDSDTDMKTSKNAGVDEVAVTYGFRDKAILEEFKPKFMINNLKDLIKIIKK
jgi:phosphoglycolate phosphatase